MDKEQYKRARATKRFASIIEKFVDENFEAYGCRECHEVGHNLVPQDHKGSYEKAIVKLMKQLKL